MAKLTAKIYTQQGKETGTQELNSDIFGISVNPDLIYQAVVAQLANSRHNLAHSQERGEVRGGGRKPWRQKGTGRARHGSNRSPLWIGGAVTFGPRNDRNFSKRINKKMKRKALFMALSDRAVNESLVLLEKLSLENIKTKDLKKVLDGISSDKKILLVIDKKDDKIVRSASNISGVKVILADSLNVYDVINAKRIVMTKDSLAVLENTYLNSIKKKEVKKVTKKEKPAKKEAKKVEKAKKVKTKTKKTKEAKA